MMESTKTHSYDKKLFHEFLVKQMKMTHDSANSYVSYVNKISQLLDKPVKALAFDEDAFEKELNQISIYGNRNWKYGLIALYRYYHDRQVPKYLKSKERDVSQAELTAVAPYIEDDKEHFPRKFDTPIYRYMSIERYYNLIEDGYNSLVHISHWEDPYEGFIYRGGMGQTDEQTNRIYDLYKSVYGQSWMFEHEESDVLWRAMANGERGNLVRVQTTVRKLAQSILSHVNTAQGSHKESSQSLGIRIARIVYKNDAEFDEMLNPQEIGRILNGNDMDGQLDFLFFKRYGFKAEKEVRVVVLANKNRIDSSKCKRGDLLKFEIDPNKLIDGVLADPCMGRREYERLICRTKFALSDDAAINLIQKSKLFDWPVIK